MNLKDTEGGEPLRGLVEEIRSLPQIRELTQALTGRERCAAVTGLAPVHRAMVTAAVLAALSCVATMVVQIPSPMNGYVNLGDCFVLLSGWLLGPWWGAAAGGIGSMLADLLLGYGHYAPGTLIIKGAMALVAALVFKAFRKNTAGALIGGVAAEVVMVAGYFGYAALLLGKGIGAAASVPGNLVQGAVGLVAGFLLLQVARRTHLEEKVSV